MIELQGVTFSVPAPNLPGGRRVILERISFAVEEGSITCIMGISGSGKTTLLRLMAGLIKPDSGKILLNGTDIVPLREQELNRVRRGTGFIFQYGALFDSLTVGENVGFGLEQQRYPTDEIQTIVRARLHEVGLPGIEEKLPSEISGGMRKRVAMARALATSPQLIFYDEPTSGLDPVMAGVIDELIVRLRQQKSTTNIIVSHHLSSVLTIADRVLMLYDGKILANGSPDEIRQNPSPILQQFLAGRPDGPIHTT